MLTLADIRFLWLLFFNSKYKPFKYSMIMEHTITDANFNDILAEGKPVLVDFWAPWCGPCRMLSPIVEELAKEYEGKAIVAKCNVDEAQEVPMKFGIRNIPTILFFKNGELADKVVGAAPKSDIAKKLEALL